MPTDDLDHIPLRSKDDFIVFGAPQILEDEINEVVASMRAAWLGTGPKVARFENEFAAYIDAPHALAVNSCTAALHLAILAAGIGPGDEVITTALTFCATANAIIHAGATPVVADIDPISMNIDPASVSDRITPKTKAVIPVHFAGRPCDMDQLTALASAHGLILIEDCAHAVETTYHDVHAGRFGDIGCFSFYATKNLTTGEGGMLITNSDVIAEDVKMRALHGMTRDAWRRYSDDGYKHYQVVLPGFKYNMMDLQAAIGLHQLARLEANWNRRRDVWEKYQSALSDTALKLPANPAPKTKHAFHLYTVLVDPGETGLTRDQFLQKMTAEGVGVGVHYLSLTDHPFYQRAFGWNSTLVPEATRVGQQTVSLPLSARLTDRDVSDVIEAVHRVLAR
ncbi:MAG: DegT/DnrJ/EryC1/StrS family aminotransferase [Thermoleophilia bacterium]